MCFGRVPDINGFFIWKASLSVKCHQLAKTKASFCDTHDPHDPSAVITREGQPGEHNHWYLQHMAMRQACSRENMLDMGHLGESRWWVWLV